MRKSSLLAFFFVALPVVATAQVTVIRVPADFSDIQSAINQAAAIVGGGTPSDVSIEVAPGTYSPSGNPGFIVDGINNPAFTVTLRAAQSAMVTVLHPPNIPINSFLLSEN